MIALLFDDRCTGCQRCVQVCPAEVFDSAGPNAIPTIARADACQTCFACELYCRADALYVDADVNQIVPADAGQVLANGLLGVYRRDSGWDEWQDSHPNNHWRMEEVFARGREVARRQGTRPADD